MCSSDLENFGIVFEGLIKIPADGTYTFYLSSDDGSRLDVAEKNIVNNDGMHGPVTKTADVPLKAGYHPFKLSYIQGGGAKLLTLYYRSDKLLGQKVPPEVLFHRKND